MFVEVIQGLVQRVEVVDAEARDDQRRLRLRSGDLGFRLWSPCLIGGSGIGHSDGCEDGFECKLEIEQRIMVHGVGRSSICDL